MCGAARLSISATYSYRVVLVFFFIIFNSSLTWSKPLDDCSEQFIGGTTTNAPTLFGSDPNKPYGSNQHLCYQDDNFSFFAIEYWPEEFTPRWAAYKLDPDNYGKKGCNTFTRKVNNCYIKAKTWQEALDCDQTKYQSDPFHTDHMLKNFKLGSSAFGNTSHDRGHIAPRSAFSWNACATYQTFSMANMSAQRGLFNQEIWRYLEQQVLTWAMDEGPIYVVSGTTFKDFPHHRFAPYIDGHLDPQYLYPDDVTLIESVKENDKLSKDPNADDLLKPLRGVKPDKVENLSNKDMKLPTAYFKVIYKPAKNNQPENAIAFLIPHTYQSLNELTEAYGIPSSDKKKSTQDFWYFRSSIKLIEQVSGITFPGIPANLKGKYSSGDWWDSRRNGREIREKTCGRGTPSGVLENSSKTERLQACTDKL